YSYPFERLYFTFIPFLINDTTSNQIYTLSLHDALPICHIRVADTRKLRQHGVNSIRENLRGRRASQRAFPRGTWERESCGKARRSEEHTSELQSRGHLVCRLLLEKKKKKLMTSRTGSLM